MASTGTGMEKTANAVENLTLNITQEEQRPLLGNGASDQATHALGDHRTVIHVSSGCLEHTVPAESGR